MRRRTRFDNQACQENARLWGAPFALRAYSSGGTRNKGKQGLLASSPLYPYWYFRCKLLSSHDRSEHQTAGYALRRQGFFGAAMLPMSELEYTGIVESLQNLDKRFTVRS